VKIYDHSPYVPPASTSMNSVSPSQILGGYSPPFLNQSPLQMSSRPFLRLFRHVLLRLLPFTGDASPLNKLSVIELRIFPPILPRRKHQCERDGPPLPLTCFVQNCRFRGLCDLVLLLLPCEPNGVTNQQLVFSLEPIGGGQVCVFRMIGVAAFFPPPSVQSAVCTEVSSLSRYLMRNV